MVRASRRLRRAGGCPSGWIGVSRLGTLVGWSQCQPGPGNANHDRRLLPISEPCDRNRPTSYNVGQPRAHTANFQAILAKCRAILSNTWVTSTAGGVFVDFALSSTENLAQSWRPLAVSRPKLARCLRESQKCRAAQCCGGRRYRERRPSTYSARRLTLAEPKAPAPLAPLPLGTQPGTSPLGTSPSAGQFNSMRSRPPLGCRGATGVSQKFAGAAGPSIFRTRRLSFASPGLGPSAAAMPFVKFENIAREWRCKWSADSDNASLMAAQALLDEALVG